MRCARNVDNKFEQQIKAIIVAIIFVAPLDKDTMVLKRRPKIIIGNKKINVDFMVKLIEYKICFIVIGIKEFNKRTSNMGIININNFLLNTILRTSLLSTKLLE